MRHPGPVDTPELRAFRAAAAAFAASDDADQRGEAVKLARAIKSLDRYDLDIAHRSAYDAYCATATAHNETVAALPVSIKAALRAIAAGGDAPMTPEIDAWMSRVLASKWTHDAAEATYDSVVARQHELADQASRQARIDDAARAARETADTALEAAVRASAVAALARPADVERLGVAVANATLLSTKAYAAYARTRGAKGLRFAYDRVGRITSIIEAGR